MFYFHKLVEVLSQPAYTDTLEHKKVCTLTSGNKAFYARVEAHYGEFSLLFSKYKNT